MANQDKANLSWMLELETWEEYMLYYENKEDEFWNRLADEEKHLVWTTADELEFRARLVFAIRDVFRAMGM